MTRQTLALVLPNLGGGGAERVNVDLARALVNAGYAVEFVLMKATGEFLSEAQREFSVVDLNVDKARHVPLPLCKYLRARAPTALIVHMWPLTTAAVIGWRLAGRVSKLLLVEHNVLSQQYKSWGIMHYWMMRATMSASYRWADGVAAVSRGAARETARLAWLRADQVAVIHNPIPQRVAPTEELRLRTDALWNCPPGMRVLTVGSLKDQKNHALLLRAFAQLSMMPCRLMIVGQGEREPQLRAQIAELGLQDRVILAGFHSDPSPFYATGDVFVLSSDYEGLPTVLIEAMSFGLQAVSTDCPSGPAEILEGGRLGRLVPVGDAHALANALSLSLESAIATPAMLKRRAADFSPDVSAMKYIDILGLQPRHV